MTSHDNKQLPLLRRFSIASLAAMLATAIALVLLYRQDQLAEHEHISAQRNEQTAIHLVRSLGGRISTLVAGSEGLDTQALRNNPNIGLLPAGAEMALDYNVLKLRIYDRAGRTIYSTVKDEIGGTSTHHPDYLAKALAGEATHKQEFRDTFAGTTGEMHDVYVALSYTPLVYAGRQIGAVEIYKDATPIFAHLNANTIRIPLVVFGGFAWLYAALFFYIRRAERTIAERQQALQESEKHLRMLEQQKLVQTSLDGFWVVRAKDGRFLEVNDAFCRMVGYSREELLTLCIADLEADESPDEIAAHLAKVMADGYDRFETRHRHKQGHLVDLEVSVSHAELDGGVNFVFARDITGRKRMQTELAAREREFRTLAENIPDNIIRYDRECRQIYANPRVVDVMQELLGRIPVGKTPNEAYPDGSFSEYDKVLRRVIATGGMEDFEFVLPDTGDGVRYHMIRMAAEKDAAGVVVGAIAMGRDITERKQMEQALAAREQEFRSLAESSPDFIIRYDGEHRIRYINNNLIRKLGLASAEEVIGKRPIETWPDGRFAVIDEAAVRAVETESATTIELRVHTDGGEADYHQISVVPECDVGGQVVGTIAFGRDITERKRMEISLLESETRFRSLFESATDCMLILDMEGRIVDINRTGYKRLGYTEQEMLGRRIAEFDTPEYAPLVAERLANFGKEGSAIFESAHVRKDGTSMPVEINTRIIQIDGEYRYFSVIRDITERKRAEQQLQKLSAYLQTVREQEKAHLAREVHDELGSTLSALKIEMHLLGNGLSDEQKKMPLFARVESMSELFDDALKSMRRIVTDLRPTVLDDLGLMAALEWQAEQFHKHTGIVCGVACVHRVKRGCTDCKDCGHTRDKTVSISLFRIFQESLTNVARHSGASRVEVEFEPCEREIVLSVSDNGRGLPGGHVIAPTSNGIRGMRERVEQLSGEIKFDKPLGGGFRVIVKLPQPVGS